MRETLQDPDFSVFIRKIFSAFEKPTNVNLFLFAFSFQNDFSGHSTQSQKTDSAGFMGEQRLFNGKLKSFLLNF